MFTIIDPVDDSKHKWSSGAVLLSGTLLSVTYDDMLASCDGVNVFGRRYSKQWRTGRDGLLIRGSQVRILPGTPELSVVASSAT
jgi:hypothetical protein